MSYTHVGVIKVSGYVEWYYSLYSTSEYMPVMHLSIYIIIQIIMKSFNYYMMANLLKSGQLHPFNLIKSPGGLSGSI